MIRLIPDRKVTMRDLVTILIALFVLLSAEAAWAGEPTCDALPIGSLSRNECEHNLAKIKARKQRESDTAPRLLDMTIPRENPILRLYKVVATVDADTFVGSPYHYEGQAILLEIIRFNRVLGPSEATFTTRRNREILISGLPLDFNLNERAWYSFIVRPLGVSRGLNAFGGPVTTPHADFLSLP